MITATFVKGKETKRTWRYESENDEISGSLYLQKEKVAELGNPEKLTVTVDVE